MKEVLDVIARFAEVGDAEAALELTSLETVQLAEALEAEFDFVIFARELNADNFATAARIVEFVKRKRR